MTDPKEPNTPSETDASDHSIGGWKPFGGATIRAVPSMSDQFFRLATNLCGLSRKHSNDISLSAGTVIVGIAALEAYVNELAETALRDPNRSDFDALRNNLVRKLQLLNSRGTSPDQFSSDVVNDIALLYGIRGRLMHYRTDPEHPIETSTSLQRLVERLPPAKTKSADVSTEQLLTPGLAEWTLESVTEAIRGLYRCGWEPPRPLWYRLVDLGPRAK